MVGNATAGPSVSGSSIIRAGTIARSSSIVRSIESATVSRSAARRPPGQRNIEAFEGLAQVVHHVLVGDVADDPVAHCAQRRLLTGAAGLLVALDGRGDVHGERHLHVPASTFGMCAT